MRDSPRLARVETVALPRPRLRLMLMSGRLRGTEMQPVHQIVEFIFAAGDEGERDDLSLGEQDERALAHDDLIAQGLGEISAQQLPRLNFQCIRLAFGVE